MPNPGVRTQRLFEDLGIAPATRAASGRYLRSEPLRSGIRYWAGHARGQDLFGVQFLADGLSDAERLGSRLVQAGFNPRPPQSSQLTFCRAIDVQADGTPDLIALRETRAVLDTIIV
ncbi:hypothetical protein [Brevundimonas nasdae]|uniref:Uncharacterized protein n=1 Tax=Brevundimonas nasdae TaxID=172043 RepID=A0ABX8TJV1_9CAUL|nr:hypothetical protein [Brevundimonas nasdae]QYC11481.1 hypothetical protein KWG56_05760 [Brevundimonas nasdae]QYC14269.1 hypothetical protein KWG63_01095 [Brevundimonas nasdae]